MTRNKKQNGVSSPAVWHSAMVADRIMRAEHLRLPSGASILAVKPEPLEWVLSGRIPQNLLGAAIEAGPHSPGDENRVMTREEILDLARFARQLVKASVVEPPIGDGPGQIALDDIPVKDRAYIFEWACRALRKRQVRDADAIAHHRGMSAPPSRDDRGPARHGSTPGEEDLSSEKLERFCKE